jgi:hypothetical protein
VQRVDGLPGLLADLVGQRQRTDDGAVDKHVQDDGALFAPGARFGQLGLPSLLEQAGPADLHGLAVDSRRHADGR